MVSFGGMSIIFMDASDIMADYSEIPEISRWSSIIMESGNTYYFLTLTVST